MKMLFTSWEKEQAKCNSGRPVPYNTVGIVNSRVCWCDQKDKERRDRARCMYKMNTESKRKKCSETAGRKEREERKADRQDTHKFERERDLLTGLGWGSLCFPLISVRQDCSPGAGSFRHGGAFPTPAAGLAHLHRCELPSDVESSGLRGSLSTSVFLSCSVFDYIFDWVFDCIFDCCVFQDVF